MYICIKSSDETLNKVVSYLSSKYDVEYEYYLGHMFLIPEDAYQSEVKWLADMGYSLEPSPIEGDVDWYYIINRSCM